MGITWLNEGWETGYTSSTTGVVCAKTPYKAIIHTPLSGTTGYNGITCTPSGQLIVRNVQVWGNRYSGIKGFDNAELHVDSCWVHHNYQNGILTNNGTSNQCVIHRTLSENNGMNWHNNHGIYVGDRHANGYLIDRCIISGNAGWGIDPDGVSATVTGTVRRSLVIDGKYTMLWSGLASNTTDRCSFWSLQYDGNFNGSSITYSASDQRLTRGVNNVYPGSGQTITVGAIYEDDASAGTLYQSASGGTTNNATLTSDTGASPWVDITSQLPLDKEKRFYWAGASTAIGCGDNNMTLAEALSLYPDGMFANEFGEWPVMPIFPEDAGMPHTAVGLGKQLSLVDVRFDGVTGAQAAEWNYDGNHTPTDWASMRLPASKTTANRWGVNHAGTAEWLLNPIAGHTSGTSQVYLEAVTAAGAGDWDLTLHIQVDTGTEVTYSLNGHISGPFGGGTESSPTWLSLPTLSANKTVSGADFTNATCSIRSQVA